MIKKVTLINSENDEIISSIISYFESKTNVEVLVVEAFDEVRDCDLVVLTSFENIKIEKTILDKCVINLHSSLLPAFQNENALKEAFSSGVKVSGVTIHKIEPDNFYGQIIAQYPILIGLDTHYEEYLSELISISKKLYPIVIETILENKVFDFTELLKTSPCHSSGCSSCGGCHN